MAWGTKVAPVPDPLPPWAKGRISLFAFEALKRCEAPRGYIGRRDTMRRLADKGLVRQIESGAYVVTENGIDLIEGRCRYPVELSDAAIPPIKRYTSGSRHPSQEATGVAKAFRPAVAPYTVEPIAGGCDMIRPRFDAVIRHRKGRA